ncbi:MAG TPA: hypothetical protein VMG39_10090 [Pseudolabrys sp.]|nr:hypothetical protein [Pseudolabrys sp.]
MNGPTIARIVSVLVGAAVLFGLQHGLDVKFYIALPVAILSYLAVKVGLGLLLGAGKTT